jgi:two-component system sensor histidine kinase/response regulator
LPPGSYLRKLWLTLSGNPEHFPLNARIFHSVCVISLLALGYNIPFNYVIGLPKVALTSLVFFGMIGFTYYWSRIRNQVQSSVFLFNIIALFLFAVTYFLNSGKQGPTDIFFLLMIILTVGISPSNQYKFWIPINIGLVLLLNLFEYMSPDTIQFTYNNRLSSFADHMSAYVVAAAVTYFCTDYVRVCYENERASAIEKSRSIEEKNSQILKQNQELERLNAEKNKLMSIVAHDLRSPLGSIQNFLELLTDHDLNDDQKLDIENDLLASTKNTMAMLSKLLDWSKSQLHGVAANLEYLNLARLFEPTLIIEKDIAANKNITLDYWFDPTITIFADSDMMQLVLRNIVGNAIKFTHNDGLVTIRAELTDNDCLITIQDNGIGISKEKQDGIFSLNVQSTYGTKNEKGVGLGLILCMEFIKAQNGRIWFTSSAEKGTCFYISVPVGEDSAMWPSGLS